VLKEFGSSVSEVRAVAKQSSLSLSL